MRTALLILACFCLVALAVCDPDDKQAGGASAFDQLTKDQRTCVVAKVQADRAIFVSIYKAPINYVVN